MFPSVLRYDEALPAIPNPPHSPDITKQQGWVSRAYLKWLHQALMSELEISLVMRVWKDERNQVLIAYLWIRQKWNDAYLKWNKEDYDGLEVIHIPSNLVWRPDLVLYNKYMYR